MHGVESFKIASKLFGRRFAYMITIIIIIKLKLNYKNPLN
jgi:hypothetical protein